MSGEGKKRKLPSWIAQDESSAGEEAAPSDVQDLPSARPGQLGTGQDNVDDNDDDDYLNMTFDTISTPSSLLSRQQRIEIQKQERGKTKQKTTLQRQQESRDVALQKSLLDSNDGPASKARRMMEKMGYTSGTSLGTRTGLVEPLAPQEYGSRGGIGLANQQRREILEQTNEVAKQDKVEQSEYRDTVRSELEERKLEGRIHAAQKICETLDTKRMEEEDAGSQAGDPATDTRKATTTAALLDPRGVNVLWRSLVLQRRERDRERQMRQQMLDGAMSFSGREYNEDLPRQTDMSADVMRGPRQSVVEEDGEDESDEELEEFELLDGVARLERILAYLREEHFYCFWCGCKYSDATDLEACPGLSEEEHE